MKFYYEALNWKSSKHDRNYHVLLKDKHYFNGNTKMNVPRVEMAKTSWTFDVEIKTEM